MMSAPGRNHLLAVARKTEKVPLQSLALFVESVALFVVRILATTAGHSFPGAG